MKPNRIRFRLGDGSKKSISTLRDQDYNRKEIVELIDMGADLKKVTELSSQGFRKDEIRHFVDNDMWLGRVSKLQKRGVPPSTTKKLITKIKQIDNLDKYPAKKQIEY